MHTHTLNLLRQNFSTRRPLHTQTFTHKFFYTQFFLHTGTFTPICRCVDVDDDDDADEDRDHGNDNEEEKDYDKGDVENVRGSRSLEGTLLQELAGKSKKKAAKK